MTGTAPDAPPPFPVDDAQAPAAYPTIDPDAPKQPLYPVVDHQAAPEPYPAPPTAEGAQPMQPVASEPPTAVPVQQQAAPVAQGAVPVPVHPTELGEWETGLCECCTDCQTACYTFCCQPCAFGSVAKKVDDSNCFLFCCMYMCLHTCCLQGCIAAGPRKHLRTNHNWAAKPCGDCLVHTCCSPCAVCQELRVCKKFGASPAPASAATNPTMEPQPQKMA